MKDRIQLPLDEIKLAFVASCVEGVARRLGIPYIDVYERMKRVDMIDKYIMSNYDVLHTESSEYLIDDVIEWLHKREKNV